jgi:hypothetical protein
MSSNNLTSVYDLEYFSGSQAAIYIGDVWVDEITSFSYELRQSKTPLFGYASQLRDALAKGQVIVQGQFSINFKEQGYLWAVLRRWFSYGAGLPTGRDMLGSSQANSLVQGKLNTSGVGGAPIRGSNGTLVSRAGIERLSSGDATRSERYEFYNSMAGYSTFSGNAKDKTFEDIVEAFEDQLWSTQDNDTLLQQMRRCDDNAFDGFDIYCTFGNYSNPKANHTTCKIVGAAITGHSKVVVIDGNPIQEIYPFIAKAVI